MAAVHGIMTGASSRPACFPPEVVVRAGLNSALPSRPEGRAESCSAEPEPFSAEASLHPAALPGAQAAPGRGPAPASAPSPQRGWSMLCAACCCAALHLAAPAALATCRGAPVALRRSGPPHCGPCSIPAATTAPPPASASPTQAAAAASLRRAQSKLQHSACKRTACHASLRGATASADEGTLITDDAPRVRPLQTFISRWPTSDKNPLWAPAPSLIDIPTANQPVLEIIYSLPTQCLRSVPSKDLWKDCHF